MENNIYKTNINNENKEKIKIVIFDNKNDFSFYATYIIWLYYKSKNLLKNINFYNYTDYNIDNLNEYNEYIILCNILISNKINKTKNNIILLLNDNENNFFYKNIWNLFFENDEFPILFEYINNTNDKKFFIYLKNFNFDFEYIYKNLQNYEIKYNNLEEAIFITNYQEILFNNIKNNTFEIIHEINNRYYHFIYCYSFILQDEILFKLKIIYTNVDVICIYNHNYENNYTIYKMFFFDKELHNIIMNKLNINYTSYEYLYIKIDNIKTYLFKVIENVETLNILKNQKIIKIENKNYECTFVNTKNINILLNNEDNKKIINFIQNKNKKSKYIILEENDEEINNFLLTVKEEKIKKKYCIFLGYQNNINISNDLDSYIIFECHENILNNILKKLDDK